MGGGPSAVADAPLTAELSEWVREATPAWQDSRRSALMRRLGWLGPDVPTLEETGAELDLTRERVRQLEVKLLKLLGRRKPPNGATAAAVMLIAAAKDAPVMGPGEAMMAAGLTRVPMPDRGVEHLFGLLGQSEAVTRYRARAAGHLTRRKAVLHEAKSLAGSVGTACIEWVGEATGAAADDVRAILARERWCQFLDESWFWNPFLRPGRNRAENATITMLAACGPLTVTDLRDGLDRLHRFRGAHMPHVPSLSALRMFYAANPHFALGPDDVVSSRERLDPEERLGRIELALLQIFRDAPFGVLDRNDLMRRGVAAGLNRNSLTVATSYSLILDNPAQDRWTLRGSRVSPAALESVGHARQPRLRDEEWQASGALRVRREVGTTWSMVVSLPRAYERIFGGRAFEAVDDNGEPVGQIRFNDTGTSWGYSPFLQTLDAAEGDLLVADFDLVSARCRLSLARRSLWRTSPTNE